MDEHLIYYQISHSYQSVPSTRSPFDIDLPSASHHPLFYVGIYAAIGLLHALCTVSSVAAQYTGALRASRVLFKWVGYLAVWQPIINFFLLDNFWSLLSELPSDSTILLLKVSSILSLSKNHLVISKLKGAWLTGLERYGQNFSQRRSLIAFDWKDMTTNLASSLQSVNSSLANFFASITITVALVWFYFQIGKSSNKCIRQRCISLLPGARLFHWLCLSGVGDWIFKYRSWFAKNGIEYKIPHFLGLWRNTGGNSHCQSILCRKKVSQQCFRQDWYDYQGRILLLYAILEQLLIFWPSRCGIIFWWRIVGFEALGALSVLITTLFSISTLTNEAGLAGLCITSAMAFTTSGK